MELYDLSLFRHKRILYFSPHHDDLVLSSGGIIRRLSNLCDEIHLVNVFTNSLWAPNFYHGRTKDEITSCRTKENGIYCKTIHLRNDDLGFDDSMVRGYDDYGELNSDYLKDSLNLIVANVIRSILDKEEYDICFCPLALGNHIDHQIVKNAILSNAKIAKKRVFFYEDLPYAANLSQDEMNEFENNLALQFNNFHFDITSIAKEKRQDIAIYKSQLEDGLIEKVLDYARRFNEKKFYERVWVTS